MSSLNKVMLIGRLGQDPTLREAGGVPVCNFSIATSKSWHKNGEKQERTEWHRIVTWRQLATRCSEYLRKGRLVYVEGELQTRKWKNQASEVTGTEIVAHDVQFLDSSKSTGASPELPFQDGEGDVEVPF